MPARRNSEDLGWREALGRRYARRAHEGVCDRCGAAVVAGLDADALAFPVRADPTPISRDFEFECQLDARPTYAYDAGVLTRRTDSLLNHWNARRTVLAQHRCESPVPPRGMASDDSMESEN